MQVTSVKTYRVINSQKIIALASITLDNSLALTGLKVIQGTNGRFISYPSTGEEEYREVFFPTAAKLRNHIEEEILKELDKDED